MRGGGRSPHSCEVWEVPMKTGFAADKLNVIGAQASIVGLGGAGSRLCRPHATTGAGL